MRYDFKFYRQTGDHFDPQFERIDWNKYGDTFKEAFRNLMAGRFKDGTQAYAVSAPGRPIDPNDKLISIGYSTLYHILSAIDPETGQFTEDVLAGFLPPNGDNHEGEGFVKFSISPRPELTTGTKIDNMATIVFDWNPPIDTPPVFNTIDAQAPSSQVLSLPAQSPQAFTVSWTGQDDTDGSGLAAYDIYASADGAPYILWLKDTKATGGLFYGTGGKTYSFYSVARDYVGNREQAPTVPDTVTTALTNHAPSSPSVQFPTDLKKIAIPTPTLSIYNSLDEDEDQLTYEFEIYQGQDLTPPAITSVSQVPEGDTITSWLCETSLSVDTWYSWRARAFDGIDYSEWMSGASFFIGQEIPFDLPLSKGWSMISLPVEPIDRRVKALFPEAQAVFGYLGQNEEYTDLDPNSALLETGKGYWIYVPEEKTYSLR
ncbi:MAG: hypothetical protein ACMUIA_04960 [bacterium]